MRNRIISAVFTLAVILMLIPAFAVPVSAAEYSVDLSNGSISITNGTDSGYKLTQGETVLQDDLLLDTVIHITQSKNIMFTSNNITVDAPISAGDGVNVIIDDIYISTSACPFGINNGSKVNLTLEGTNGIISYNDCAGIHVPYMAEIIIDGVGSLEIDSDYGSCIGGTLIDGNDGSVGAITIKGGAFDLYSPYGTAIGAVKNGKSKPINIQGGNITTRSSLGIGGNNANVTITGGNINTSGICRTAL